MMTFWLFVTTLAAVCTVLYFCVKFCKWAYHFPRVEPESDDK